LSRNGTRRGAARFDPFLSFDRAGWAALRDSTPLTLSDAELRQLRGVTEEVSLDEVAEIYLPLTRLLNLRVLATRALHDATDVFLGRRSANVPFVIGIAGSVAAGKSTTARVLRALLARWPDHPRVDLVTTDGFLYPNRVLDERGLLRRKGFPESYDVRALLNFVADVKAGRPRVTAPVYSHLRYDVVSDATVVVEQPDVIIIEGLNVLQGASPAATAPGRPARPFVSDFFDFSIYVDADEADLRRWYVERFLRLRETAFQSPESYFHTYARLTTPEAMETANTIWTEINDVNLRENILPTRERAHLVLGKAGDHAVHSVRLRKL
jgi:type I pantothenate kinase